MKRAFTIIELMVVVAIIVILAGIVTPAIKSMAKGAAESQAVNMIRAELSAARAAAISQHRKAGVVFFEETPANIQPANTNQTAMQLFIEDFNQSRYGATGQENTVYIVTSTERQYLPSGIVVATLSADSTTGAHLFNAKNGTTINAVRAILFNADGQVDSSYPLCSPDPSGAATPATNKYPKAYGDWKMALPSFVVTYGTDASGNSYVTNPGPAPSGAFLVYRGEEYNQQTFADDAARTNWISQHADLITVNSYTGSVIR